MLPLEGRPQNLLTGGIPHKALPTAPCAAAKPMHLWLQHELLEGREDRKAAEMMAPPGAGAAPTDVELAFCLTKAGGQCTRMDSYGRNKCTEPVCRLTCCALRVDSANVGGFAPRLPVLPSTLLHELSGCSRRIADRHVSA